MKLSKMLMLSAVLALPILAPGAVYAHGFGERYDLPVPLGLYIAGAGATVLFSFVVIGIFAKGAAGQSYPRYNLLRWKAGRLFAHSWVLAAVKALSVFLFIVYVIAGLFGTEDPNENLAPTLTWIIFWVGIAYVTAFLGNVWALVNPWKVMFGWAEAAYSRLAGGKQLTRANQYPEQLGAWPAVALFFGFAWLENVYPDSAIPFDLTMFVLVYTVATFAGMVWYGRDVWLKNGEIFSIAFGYLASLSPTEVRVVPARPTEAAQGTILRAAGRVEGGKVVVATQAHEGRALGDLVDDYEAYTRSPAAQREWNVRPWGAGLLSAPRPSVSHMAFLLLMLSTVTFDGFGETPLWATIWTNAYNAIVGIFGLQASAVIRTVGLAVFPVVFFAAFGVTAQLIARMGRSSMGTIDIMQAFVYSLVPIAVAYHVAHFLGFLFIQGQRIIALVSDPFGYGWDLFGTAGYTVNIAVVDARFAWIVSVAAIVIGHIVAVYAAHVYATRLFPSRAVRSQYPMMVLMVAYTMVSLWIIAQPVVEAG